MPYLISCFFAVMGLWISIGLYPIASACQENSSKEPNSTASLSSLIRASENQISTVVLAPASSPTLTRWVPSPHTTLEGQVLIFDDKEVICRKPGEPQVLRYPSHQVIAIDIAWGSDEAKVAHELYSKQQYKDAIKAAQGALKSNIFRWQQAILVREIVDNLWAIGQYRSSATTFLKLMEERPPPLVLVSMPLVWTRTELDPNAIKAANDWLESDREEARLIAASWLLSGEKRESCIKILNGLRQSSNETIKQYATAQLWRTVPASDSLSPLLAEWSSIRDAMPIYLQAGPTMLIADKLDQSGSGLLAVPEWTRVAILHADRVAVKSVAIQKIRQTLMSQGQEAEAKRLEEFLSSNAK